ncbi:Lipopolysaccharide-induced tumor necrosis factor-alpha factor-like protein [Aphelenchoides besseyi]|nr:Lipopolysaccharide-induced tumor necrosis factor-alpha factor-like protein [Aphelenchoides besseyi]KAI6208163.1 Lipopolysaccharide-induced tumor necrosis factor-alpha factor-like protein [Aphelenchoides besseyi]
MPSERSKSVPIMIHRSSSYTPSMIVNAKRYLSDHAQLIDCPRCKHHGETEMRYVNGLMTWLSFFIILVLGIFIFPLFFLWVPFYVETFKDVVHHCSNCRAWIGTYRRLGKSL